MRCDDIEVESIRTTNRYEAQMLLNVAREKRFISNGWVDCDVQV